MSHSDVQAEKAVLGAVLCGATRAAVQELRADDFTDVRAHVWRAVEHLFQRGVAVDHVTLSETLKTQGRLSEVLSGMGGPGSLMDLDEGGRWMLRTDGLSKHVAIIRDRARRRRLAEAAKQLEAMAYDLNLTTDRIAAEASAAALAAGGLGQDGDESGDVDFWEINDRWDKWNKMTPEERVRHEPYLPMPWEWMREEGFYGFPQSLSVVAGRSGIGKTAMLSTCMAYWLRVLPHHGAVIGLEDGTAWLDERWLASSLGIDYAAVANTRLNEWQAKKYEDHAERIVPLLATKLRKYRRAGMTAGQLLAQCRRWVDEGVKWIIVDHGLRITYESDGRMREDRVIGKAMDDLANLALNNKVHVIVAWHLNRSSDDDAQPTLGDLKESGYLDAAARAIFGLWRKGDRSLMTVVKATKVARVGTTCDLVWKERSGMFDTTQGRVVDFAAEARAAKEQQKSARNAVKLFGGEP